MFFQRKFSQIFFIFMRTTREISKQFWRKSYELCAFGSELLKRVGYKTLSHSAELRSFYVQQVFLRRFRDPIQIRENRFPTDPYRVPNIFLKKTLMYSTNRYFFKTNLYALKIYTNVFPMPTHLFLKLEFNLSKTPSYSLLNRTIRLCFTVRRTAVTARG